MDYFELTQRAIDWIEARLDERVCMHDLARVAYCSEAHFSRIFRAVVGRSVMEYVRERRLSLAGRELTLPGVKVLDVALKYGYETPQAFTKAFRRFHGISPMACKKRGPRRYLERAFPLVAKMKLMEGVMNMDKFGSPLQQIITELGKESDNLYFCFNANGRRYAVGASSIWTVYPPWEMHINTEGKLFQHLWERDHPVVGLEETAGLTQLAEGKQNILQCRTPEANRSVNHGEGVFGLIIDGSLVLKIAKALKPAKNPAPPFATQCARFADEELPIFDTQLFWDRENHRMAKSFDKSEDTPAFTPMETLTPRQRLERAAFNAELLSRNASIEAANGGALHRGTMIVAHELYQHAVEIAEIARELRGK
ncbi:MAG: helix-turn-helix domain-containing protein [Defluviitaleaceae bacterium]|nr:helix-turn-helix domain-containing protein [Defluviitaleaceae bacterium]MCL2240052.1 helix-turn-helix domain-containing protein [Defluviitaleaceae bacterium]